MSLCIIHADRGVNRRKKSFYKIGELVPNHHHLSAIRVISAVLLLFLAALAALTEQFCCDSNWKFGLRISFLHYFSRQLTMILYHDFDKRKHSHIQCCGTGRSNFFCCNCDGARCDRSCSPQPERIIEAVGDSGQTPRRKRSEG